VADENRCNHHKAAMAIADATAMAMAMAMAMMTLKAIATMQWGGGRLAQITMN
jgi:hypothetical protein